MKNRKLPLRKCVITGQQHPKQDLIRVVKNKENQVFVDHTGKINGRGAYLLKDHKVIKKAIKSKKLDRHLGIQIPDSIYEELLGLFDE